MFQQGCMYQGNHASSVNVLFSGAWQISALVSVCIIMLICIALSAKSLFSIMRVLNYQSHGQAFPALP